MESTGLASYSPFNGRLGDFGTSGCLPYSSHTHRANGFSGCDGLSPPADLVNGKSSSNSTSKSTSSCTSGAFDEDFEVNEDEEVKTPRTSSPTLAELQKMLVTGSLCSKNSFSVPAGDFGKTELPNSVLKSFSLRPCQYPLERLYDESIPVKSFRRSLKEAKLLNSESHNLQRLESILPCLPSPLPRLTSYSSSSGSLIGDLHGLSFKPDDLVMSDTPVPSVLNSNRSDCMSLTRCSTDLKAEPSVMAGQTPVFPNAECHGKNCREDRISPSKSLNNQSNESNAEKCMSCSADSVGDSTHLTESGVDIKGSTLDELFIDPEFSSLQSTSRNEKSNSKSKRSKESTRPRCDSSGSSLRKPRRTGSRRRNELPSGRKPNESEVFPSPVPVNATAQPNRPTPDTSVNTSTSETKIKVSVPVIVCPDVPAPELHLNSVSSFSSVRLHDNPTEDSQSADEEFTLVVNRKSRRKQKLQQQQQQKQKTEPLSPRSTVSSTGSVRVNSTYGNSTSQGKSQHSFSMSRSLNPSNFKRYSAPVTQEKNKTNDSRPGLTANQRPLNRLPNPVSTSPDRTSGYTSGSTKSEQRSVESLASTSENSSEKPIAGRYAPRRRSFVPPNRSSPPRNKKSESVLPNSSNSRISLKQHEELKHFLLSVWDSFRKQSACL